MESSQFEDANSETNLYQPLDDLKGDESYRDSESEDSFMIQSGMVSAQLTSSSMENRKSSLVSSKGSFLYHQDGQYDDDSSKEMGDESIEIIRLNVAEGGGKRKILVPTLLSKQSPASARIVARSTESTPNEWNAGLLEGLATKEQEQAVEGLNDETDEAWSTTIDPPKSEGAVRRMRSLLGPKIRIVSKAPWDKDEEDAIVQLSPRHLDTFSETNSISSQRTSSTVSKGKENQKSHSSNTTSGVRAKIRGLTFNSAIPSSPFNSSAPPEPRSPTSISIRSSATATLNHSSASTPILRPATFPVVDKSPLTPSDTAPTFPSFPSLPIGTLGLSPSAVALDMVDQTPPMSPPPKMVLISLDEARKRDSERVQAAKVLSMSNKKALSIAVDRANGKEGDSHSSAVKNSNSGSISPAAPKSLGTKRSGFFKRMNSIFITSSDEQNAFQSLSNGARSPSSLPGVSLGGEEGDQETMSHDLTLDEVHEQLAFKPKSKIDPGLLVPSPLLLRPISMGFSGLPVHFLDVSPSDPGHSQSNQIPLTPINSPPSSPYSPAHGFDVNSRSPTSTFDTRTSTASPVASPTAILDYLPSRVSPSIIAVDVNPAQLTEYYRKAESHWLSHQFELESQIKDLRVELDRFMGNKKDNSGQVSVHSSY
jgi:hypothetical protein